MTECCIYTDVSKDRAEGFAIELWLVWDRGPPKVLWESVGFGVCSEL